MSMVPPLSIPGAPLPALGPAAAGTASLFDGPHPPTDVIHTGSPMANFREYRIKQYGTNALISGGTIAAGVFIFAPEPFITKIIGGTIALSCIAAGGFAKHLVYRDAFVHRALENSLGKLHEELDSLGVEINILETTGRQLAKTNMELQQSRDGLQAQVLALREQTGILRTEIVNAFEQLRHDRDAFETEKAVLTRQLERELSFAGARSETARQKLEELDIRHTALRTLAEELAGRRTRLVREEEELDRMQIRMVKLLESTPGQPVKGGPEAARRGGRPAMPRPVIPVTGTNLETLAALPQHPGARLSIHANGEFIIQPPGFFNQQLPRMLTPDHRLSIRSREFRWSLIRFFHEARENFSTDKIQSALDGLRSLEQTYSKAPGKARLLQDLIEIIQTDNRQGLPVDRGTDQPVDDLSPASLLRTRQEEIIN